MFVAAALKGARFLVLNGDEKGRGESLDTGIKCEVDTWYKMSLLVDVPNRRWEFFSNDKKAVLQIAVTAFGKGRGTIIPDWSRTSNLRLRRPSAVTGWKSLSGKD
jgi:hypothetical protein